jgi:hypothetical protein
MATSTSVVHTTITRGEKMCTYVIAHRFFFVLGNITPKLASKALN